SNTVTKAYNEYFGHSNKEKKRVTVYLEKKVPRQAGLGGGSSNAGFLLTELNKKYKFYSKDEMLVIAKKVGADVPFFIDNKTSRVSGIGEKISFLENNIKEKILLVKPTYIGVSTRLAFSLYGENTNELKVSNLDNIEKAIKDGNVLELEKNIENTLEQIVLQNNMKLAKFKVEIESLYGKKFFMSGSGSTFFTFISKQEESEIRKKMNYRISRKYFTRITRFL
ncbi:MAG: 4-(cytidine 5'-diphospho)-2-C-methyl-D-erythritol kinase, partial [Leptotrichiaceae bacterium]